MIAPGSGNPVIVVMIEDDPGHARLIERNVRRAGINNEIKAFATGNDALTYLLGNDGSGIAERAAALRLAEEARDRAEMLVAEVNHRVANSLSLAASMVQMQTRAVPDEAARAALKETQARISAIAAIHRHLYTSADVRFVDLDTYLANLTGELGAAMRADDVAHEISFRTSEKVRVPTNTAVSLGILITELVTNAYKYAYEKDVRGQIRVKLDRRADGGIALAVEDDGIGWNGNGTPRGSGLGTRIIRATTGQVHATLSYDPAHKGTRAVLELPIPPLN